MGGGSAGRLRVLRPHADKRRGSARAGKSIPNDRRRVPRKRALSSSRHHRNRSCLMPTATAREFRSPIFRCSTPKGWYLCTVDKPGSRDQNHISTGARQRPEQHKVEMNEKTWRGQRSGAAHGWAAREVTGKPGLESDAARLCCASPLEPQLARVQDTNGETEYLTVWRCRRCGRVTY